MHVSGRVEETVLLPKGSKHSLLPSCCRELSEVFSTFTRKLAGTRVGDLL